MKKFSALLSLALLVSLAASAQSFRYGVTAGMNVASFKMKADGFTLGNDSRIGFNAGFRAELDAPFIFDGCFLDGELLLSSKGTKLDLSDGETTVRNTGRPYYLELPIHIGYRYYLGEQGNVSIFGTFGPYFAIGLFGKNEANDNGTIYKPDIFSKYGMKRFDFGLGLRAGVQLYEHYQIFVGYDWGLINVAQDTEDNYSIKNRNFYVGAAYMF